MNENYFRINRQTVFLFKPAENVQNDDEMDACEQDKSRNYEKISARMITLLDFFPIADCNISLPQNSVH